MTPREALENFRKITSPVMIRLLDMKTRDDLLLADQVHQADTKARIALAEKSPMKNDSSMEKVLELAKEAVKMPAKYWHSDIGDVLISLLKEEINCDEALEDIGHLIIDYSKYQSGEMKMKTESKVEYELFEKQYDGWISCKIKFTDVPMAAEFFDKIVKDNPGKIFGLRCRKELTFPVISNEKKD